MFLRFHHRIVTIRLRLLHWMNDFCLVSSFFSSSVATGNSISFVWTRSQENPQSASAAKLTWMTFPYLGKWPQLVGLGVSVQSSTAIFIDRCERNGKKKHWNTGWMSEGNCSIQECVANSINSRNSFACHCVFDAIYAKLNAFNLNFNSINIIQDLLANHLQPKEHSAIAYRVLSIWWNNYNQSIVFHVLFFCALLV